MRYSKEYKQNAVKLYREGKWVETPEGIKDAQNFHCMIRRWARIEEANGAEALKHKGKDRCWTPEQKLELVQQVLAGRSNQSVAIEAGVVEGLLYQWVRKYKIFGYNGLVNMKKGRPPKDPNMKKKNINNPRKLEESEYEELIRLRAENAYIKAENEVIKKEIALREAKWDEQLKARKQKSSANFMKKASH